MAQLAIPIGAMSSLTHWAVVKTLLAGKGVGGSVGRRSGHASADPACLAAQLSNQYITGRRITGGFRSCSPDRTIRNSSWLSVRRAWSP